MSNREAMLLEVIRVVRCHPDFDNGGPMAEMMDQALAGVEHPDLVVAVSNLAQGRKPPVTSRPEGGEHYDNLRRRNQRLELALIEIMKGEGPFSRNPLEHATNCIEAMKEVAKVALYDTNQSPMNGKR